MRSGDGGRLSRSALLGFRRTSIHTGATSSAVPAPKARPGHDDSTKKLTIVSALQDGL